MHNLKFLCRTFYLHPFKKYRFLSYKINIFSVLTDNYAYLLVNGETKCCAAVDPVEPIAIAKYIKDNKFDLTHILITHHHWDHSSGTKSLLSNFTNHIDVVGYDERIEALNFKVKHNQILSVGNLSVKCLFTPCHTQGHMSYFVDEQNDYAIFTGDTIFVAGCGRFFEGTAFDMYNCIKLLETLPESTKIYCGHEYTVNNLKFALSIDPENEKIRQKLMWANDRRKENFPTVPSTLKEEKETNPYFQTDNTHYKLFFGLNDPVAIIQRIREMKNDFK